MNPVPAWGSILHNLYGLQPRKMDAAFDDLLDKEINISKALRTKASESQKSVELWTNLARLINRPCERVLLVSSPPQIHS